MQVKTLDLYLEMLVSKHCSYFYRTNKSGQTVRLRKSSLVRVFTEGNVKFGESVCLLLEKIQLFYTKRKKNIKWPNWTVGEITSQEKIWAV